jgi:hypothetical protein
MPLEVVEAKGLKNPTAARLLAAAKIIELAALATPLGITGEPWDEPGYHRRNE